MDMELMDSHRLSLRDVIDDKVESSQSNYVIWSIGERSRSIDSYGR